MALGQVSRHQPREVRHSGTCLAVTTVYKQPYVSVVASRQRY